LGIAKGMREFVDSRWI